MKKIKYTPDAADKLRELKKVIGQQYGANKAKASLADLEILTETRIEVLRAANRLNADVDMSEVKKQSLEYYQKSLKDGTHLAYLIFDEETVVGAGGISYFQVMPTFHNPTGKKAYIMNM